MSNIDKQALREAAERAESDSWGYDRDEFNEALTPSTVLALLDELEAKDKRISELKSAVKSANDRYENRTPTQWAYDQACLALENTALELKPQRSGLLSWSVKNSTVNASQ